MYGVLLLGCVIGNLSHGPWQGAAFWRQQQESAQELQATAGPQDPLVQFLLPRIRRDRGIQVDEELTVSDVLQGLTGEHWFLRKGPRIALTRWGTFHDCFRELLPGWHTRLLVLLHLGLVQGWATSKTGRASIMKSFEKVQSVGAHASSSDVPKTAHEKESLRKLRDSCRNTVHLVAAAMADEAVYCNIGLIVHLTDGMRVWL